MDHINNDPYQLLKKDVQDENNNAKNSTMFSNYVRNVLIEDDEIMVSFDVTSLYTNISIIDTLYIIKDYVNNDDQFTRKTAIPQNKFLDLVHLVLTTTWYTFILSFTNKLTAFLGRSNIYNHSRNLYAGLWTHYTLQKFGNDFWRNFIL